MPQYTGYPLNFSYNWALQDSFGKIDCFGAPTLVPNYIDLGGLCS